MAMNISGDYSQFYKGTSTMDKMSKEETLAAMKEISAQYGEDVLLEFSGDGMAALVESGKRANLNEIMKSDEEKSTAFQDTVVQMENTHRIIIPNIQTNRKLYDSLEGVDETIVKTANGIIGNYFLPHNIGNMSEAERQDMIAFGMEEAKYLATNYLDEDKASEFLSAMETIAKYGVNGTVDKDGNVTYDIKKGYTVGSSIDRMDILKSKAPDLYEEINKLNYDIINHKGGEKYGTKFLELLRKSEKVLNATSEDGIKTNREKAEQEYKDWEKKTETTKLPEQFHGITYDNLQNFLASLQNQSSLTNSWMMASMNRFMNWLAG